MIWFLETQITADLSYTYDGCNLFNTMDDMKQILQLTFKQVDFIVSLKVNDVMEKNLNSYKKIKT